MLTVVNVKGLNKPEQRAGIAYVGRAFAGWPAHPLGNPHKGHYALALFGQFLDNHPRRDELLAALWEECEHGVKPLGCWCVPQPWAVSVDPAVSHCCHAQTLAVALLRRFGPRNLAFPLVPEGWFCPHDERPADGTVCDLIDRRGKVSPGLTFRNGRWLIRNFAPFDGHAVAWRPAAPE